MEGTKIILIDPQHDFTSLSGAYAQRHEGVTQIAMAKQGINRLLAQVDKSQVLVLQSDYREGQFGEGLGLCIPGTFGHQIDGDLALDETYTYITKRAHSGFSSEDLLPFLRQHGVHTFLLAGFLAEYCIRQTAIDALQHGFTVYLLEDCIGTGDDVQERRHEMIRELTAMGSKVLDVTRIAEVLDDMRIAGGFKDVSDPGRVL